MGHWVGAATTHPCAENRDTNPDASLTVAATAFEKLKKVSTWSVLFKARTVSSSKSTAPVTPTARTALTPVSD